jgi:hypothetical protein
MKKIETNNSELLEVLVNNGIDIICNKNMEMMVSEEDAERIPVIVDELAPAAVNDYAIE